LIACANVANLLTGQAAARAREMALRVSIGAGRARLTQLVLVESALVATLATAVGSLFAWWAAPYVVDRINPPDDPARLLLPLDWRVFAFGAALTVGVTFLFGLLPALRASATQPVSALKGGDDPHAKRRLMNWMIALQVAFCCVVLFVAGLLVSSFDRLANQPTGFSRERLLALDVEARPSQAPVYWDQVADHLKDLSGIEHVALAGWPLLSGWGSNGFISVNDATPGDRQAYFLNVSPGWLETMQIPLIDGRDFRPADVYPGAAIVNEAFAKEYFGGANPVGRWFARGNSSMQVVGLVRDARYRNMREPITPTAYIPFRYGGDESVSHASLMVRTSAENPLALASMLRSEVPRARTEFRVSNIRTQTEINRSQTVRERMLATLALFFAVVALLLAAIGLYGVLDYSVLQRRREIGVRLAVGAPPRRVATLVISDVFAMVACGAMLGAAMGLAAAQYVTTLLYAVEPTDPALLLASLLTLLLATAAAAIAPVVRAIRIEPASVLRVE
jgi:predicted permease